MDRAGVRQVLESSGEKQNTEKTGYKVTYNVPLILAIKGLMTMMMTYEENISEWQVQQNQ